MILNYDKRPEATVDQKVQSLMESTQLALNDISRAQETADVAKEDAQTSVALAETARTAANEASDSARIAKQAADEATAAVEEIEGDVSGLTTRVAQAETDIDAAEGSIAALGTRVGAAETNITNIEGNVTSLAGRVSDAEDDINAVEGDITSLQSDVSTAQGNITTIQGNLTSLTGRVSAAEGDITTVEGDITSLQGRVSDAEDDVEDVMKGLSLAENVVGTLNWITAHSTITTDTTPQAGTTYYIKHLDGTFEIVTDTTGKNPAQEGWYVLDEALQNYVLSHLSLTDDGLYVMADNSHWKVRIADDGVYIIDDTNGQNKTVAKYKDAITLGEIATGNYVVIDEDSFDIKHGTTEIAHFGYGDTYAPSGLTDYPFYTLGDRQTTIEPFDSTKSYWWGSMCVYNGHIYVCVSEQTTAGEWNRDDWKFYIGGYSHARGSYVTACGLYSVADGYNVRALGDVSHAVGEGTWAIGESSHAEGDETYAIGENSHAEGQFTRARGIASHAEGLSAFAIGNYSHAQNYRTIAAKDNQTVIGKYNIEDTETDESKQKAFIIGNGYYDGTNVINSNAFTVDWSGNVEASGEVTDGSGNVLSDKADSGDVYTKTQTDTLLADKADTTDLDDYVLKATPYYELDTSATSGTDKEIYDALVSLGWDSDVIV